MRTTLTLDDDVARKLHDAMRKSGAGLKETVNEILRRGFNAQTEKTPMEPFKVRARALGARPGMNYDNIGELLGQLEGPAHR